MTTAGSGERGTYSVTQSYANSFGGDIVFDTFNKVSRDEDNILDQIYIKQICSDFYYEDLKMLRAIEEKSYLKNYNSLQERVIKLGFSENSLLVCIVV